MTIPIAMDWVSTRTFPAGTRPASRPWSICSTCAPRVPRPHSLATLPPLGRHQTPPRIVCALISTRQGASSFNQPLSFDTSSVTDMSWMFYVRSPRVPWPPAFSRAFPVHTPLAPPPLHAASRPAPPRPASHTPAFDSAARYGFQPAAELRHIQRHGHGLHVLRALRACPAPQPSVGAFPVHAPLAPPPLHAASRPAASPRAAYPPFDSAARHGFQPAAELRHVQRHEHAQHVQGALRACPAALGFGQTLVPLRAACAAPAPRPASRSPAPHLAPHRMPSFRLGSPRRRSTSR